jgi:hypothetical protein
VRAGAGLAGSTRSAAAVSSIGRNRTTPASSTESERHPLSELRLDEVDGMIEFRTIESIMFGAVKNEPRIPCAGRADQ